MNEGFLLNGILGFCSDVDVVADLPGCDALSNPRRSDTSCPLKHVSLRAVTHLQAFLNSVLWIASDEMSSYHCTKLE